MGQNVNSRCTGGPAGRPNYNRQRRRGSPKDLLSLQGRKDRQREEAEGDLGTRRGRRQSQSRGRENETWDWG